MMENDRLESLSHKTVDTSAGSHSATVKMHIHFRDSKKRTVEHVDHCICEDGVLSGYTRDGRLILRVLLATIDWLEVR